MSIKPKYVKEIIRFNKKVEYRKKIFKQDIDKVYIYSSSPEKKIVGYFKFEDYFEGTPELIWEKTKEYSGISKEEYFSYFKNSNKAYAIKIKQLKLFEKKLDPNNKLINFKAPQSYMYIEYDL